MRNILEKYPDRKILTFSFFFFFIKVPDVAFRKSTVRTAQMCPELVGRVHQTN